MIPLPRVAERITGLTVDEISELDFGSLKPGERFWYPPVVAVRDVRVAAGLVCYSDEVEEIRNKALKQTRIMIRRHKAYQRKMRFLSIWRRVFQRPRQ